MWGRLVETATALTFIYCFILAIVTLGAYRGIIPQADLADWGPFLLSGGVGMVFIVVILRHGLAHWLWTRGSFQECVAYALPRSRPTALVGRTEAARNRIAAAESYIELGQTSMAIDLLESDVKPPSSAELQGLLRLAEVRARFVAGDTDRAIDLLAVVRKRVRGRAKRRLEEVEKLLTKNTELRQG